MINYFQAIILGILQGISELFPVSSLGHSVIFPSLVGWNIHQDAPYFLTFLVVTHLATAIVLVGFFWKDWVRIVLGLMRSLKEREIRSDDHDAKLAWLLIVGTIPAGVLGLLFQEPLKAFFASPKQSAFFLILNGVLLLVGEVLRRRKLSASRDSDSRIAQTSWLQAFGVGASQAIALFPGFSRTGATLVGGLFVGLSHADAAKYSFLLATPIIGSAAVLKMPDMFTKSGSAMMGQTLVGALFAGIFAYLSVRFLTKYFKTNTLLPFALYCLVMGILSSLFFLLH